MLQCGDHKESGVWANDTMDCCAAVLVPMNPSSQRAVLMGQSAEETDEAFSPASFECISGGDWQPARASNVST
jgi:hypothetical protein